MTDSWQTLTDEELARQSQSGDLAAFEDLVRRYENRIYAFVLRSCGNPSDAREITQDTFVRAYEAISGFDSKRRFMPWLFVIARRKMIDRWRVQKSVVYEEAHGEVDLETPSELLARREDNEQVWARARQALSQAQFHALWLRYAEDMEVAEIAVILGKTTIYVKVLLFRARQKLAVELGNDLSNTMNIRTSNL